MTFGLTSAADESIKSDDAKLKAMLSKLGEVTVWVTRARRTGTGRPRDDSSRAAQPTIGGSVSEKALKGRSISSRVTMKDAGFCPVRATAVMDYPYGTQPHAYFTFKYRSRSKCSHQCPPCHLAPNDMYHADMVAGDLQIEGIVPRSPSPEPLDDLDLENMTREQAIEALRQQRTQGGPSSRVKSELKRERGATQVIDLSDDDDDDDDDEGGVSITSAGPVKKRQRTSAHDSGIDTIDLTDD